MDDREKARLVEGLQRQERKRRAPGVVKAWKERGVAVVPLADDRHRKLISWLQARWRAPSDTVANFHGHLTSTFEGEDLVIVMDFWEWDRAVAVLVPFAGLCWAKDKLRELYRDGFLVMDQRVERALVVDFDDHSDGVQVAVIS